MKIAVDAERCEGHGRCYKVAPDLFVDDESGYSHARVSVVTTDELVERAQRAARACPEGAVILE